MDGKKSHVEAEQCGHAPCDPHGSCEPGCRGPDAPAAQDAPAAHAWWKPHVWPLIGITVATLAFFSPLFRGQTYSMVGAHHFAQFPWCAIGMDSSRVRGQGFPQSDDAEIHYPLSVVATEAIRNGELPLWYPYSFGGYAFVESCHFGFMYPPRLVLLWLCDPIRQHDLLMLLHCWMAGVTMYSLLRVWHANAFGATLGAVLWQLCGNATFWLVFEFIGIAAAWLPLMLLCSTLAVRHTSWKWAAACGAATAMCFLGGGPHYALLGGLILAGWYGAITIHAAVRMMSHNQPKAAFRMLALPAVSLLVTVGLAAASWLPLLPVAAASQRMPLTLEMQASIPDQGRTFTSLVQGMVFPEALKKGVAPLLDMPGLLFLGWPALAFALVGAWRQRWPAARLGTILVLLGIPLVLGEKPSLLAMRAIIPSANTFHRYELCYVLLLGLVVLAGLGATAVWEWAKVQRFKGAVAAFMLLLLVGNTAQLVYYGKRLNPRQPATMAWHYPETPLTVALRGLQQHERILPLRWKHESWEWTPPILSGQASGVFGLRSGTGYTSLVPKYVAEVWGSVEGGSNFHGPLVLRGTRHDTVPLALLNKLALRFWVTPPGVVPKDSAGNDLVAAGVLVLRHQSADGAVYENLLAQPRAQLVHAVQTAEGLEAAKEAFLNPAFAADKAAVLAANDPANTAALTKLTTLANTSGPGKLPENTAPAGNAASTAPVSSAAILSEGLNNVVVETHAAQDGLLVLHDNWHPGWKVYVDGKAQPVLRANYTFRGVLVPAGDHRVEFVYRPWTVPAGIGISLGTALLLAGALARARRRLQMADAAKLQPSGEPQLDLVPGLRLHTEAA